MRAAMPVSRPRTALGPHLGRARRPRSRGRRSRAPGGGRTRRRGWLAPGGSRPSPSGRANSAALGGEVVLDVGVVVEVVAGEVGEQGGGEAGARHPPLGEGVRGDLHRAGRVAGVAHPGEQGLQVDRVGRGVGHRLDRARRRAPRWCRSARRAGPPPRARRAAGRPRWSCRWCRSRPTTVERRRRVARRRRRRRGPSPGARRRHDDLGHRQVAAAARPSAPRRPAPRPRRRSRARRRAAPRSAQKSAPGSGVLRRGAPPR